MSANEPVPPPPANILAVDDTPANLQLLVGLLKEHGYRVRPVPSGVLALQAAAASQPDLILLDITMPEMNGYDATRAIRALPGSKSRIPIVAMTANVMEAEMQRCEEAGMDAFVPKPYETAQLLAAMERALGRSSTA